MRNKDLFETKLTNYESLTKKMGYHIHRNELDEAFAIVEVILEKVSDMRTLLNTESQD